MQVLSILASVYKGYSTSCLSFLWVNSLEEDILQHWYHDTICDTKYNQQSFLCSLARTSCMSSAFLIFMVTDSCRELVGALRGTHFLRKHHRCNISILDRIHRNRWRILHLMPNYNKQLTVIYLNVVFSSGCENEGNVPECLIPECLIPECLTEC